MVHSRRVATAFLLLTLLVTLVLPGVAQAQEPATANPVYIPMVSMPVDTPAATPTNMHLDVGASAAAAEAYWTPERVAAATPLDLLTIAQDTTTQVLPLDTAQGPTAAVSGAAPLPGMAERARRLYPEAWEYTTPDTLEEEGVDEAQAQAYYPYPSPFTRFRANYFSQMATSFPWKTIGKVYFTIPGRGNYMCSGSVGSNDVVWTAGHCVYTPGVGWHTNVVFIPAYRNGSRPYGTFSTRVLWTITSWARDENLSYDVGIIVTNPRNGYEVGQWVGYLGAMFSTSRMQQFNVFGYPGNFFSGQYNITCVTSTARADTNFNPATTGAGCDMGGGSSGGPWITRFSPYAAGAINYVNGVMSYGYVSRPAEGYTPYFGPAVRSLFDAARNN